MNLILFSKEETKKTLPTDDDRALHILKVLRIKEGDTFDVGQINGPRGKAKLSKKTHAFLELDFTWEDSIPELFPIHLLLSFTRPQTCRKILRECTAMGVSSITFFDTDRCEPAYKSSKLWTSGEYNRHIRQGAEQAFCTRIPEIHFRETLSETLSKLPNGNTRIGLDNYEGSFRLMPDQIQNENTFLAIGGERGWTNDERNQLRENGFKLAHLGERVLRVETACVASISLLIAGMA